MINIICKKSYAYNIIGGFMLRLNAKHLFAAKVIERPQGFLRNNGFTPSTANQIATGKVMQLKFKTLEKLCLVLNCTPHDLFEWVPDASVTEPGKFELSALMKDKQVVKLSEKLRAMTIAEIEEVNRFVEEKRKKK